MDSTQIEKIIEKDINSLGCDIWGVEFSGRMASQTLRVFIDKESGISIEDCENVSKHISKVLDAENNFSEDYMLEVSSPGLDRKFFKTNQYNDYLGQILKVKFLTEENTFRTIVGSLLKAEENYITLIQNKEEIEIAFDSIKKANLSLTEV